MKYSEILYYTVDRNGDNAMFLNLNNRPDENWTTFEINSGHVKGMLSEGMNEEDLNIYNGKIIVIYSMIYQDYVTKRIYKEQEYSSMNLPLNQESKFILMSPAEIEQSNQILKYHGFYNLIYPPEFY